MRCVDDSAAELAIIASNDLPQIRQEILIMSVIGAKDFKPRWIPWLACFINDTSWIYVTFTTLLTHILTFWRPVCQLIPFRTYFFM